MGRPTYPLDDDLITSRATALADYLERVRAVEGAWSYSTGFWVGGYTRALSDVLDYLGTGTWPKFPREAELEHAEGPHQPTDQPTDPS